MYKPKQQGYTKQTTTKYLHDNIQSWLLLKREKGYFEHNLNRGRTENYFLRLLFLNIDHNYYS